MGATSVDAQRAAVPERDRLEGLAWLGHEPEAKAGLGFRALVAVCRSFAARVLGLRMRTEGLETLPAGGYILACAVHRSWVDPLALLAALPPSPRIWYIGSAEIAFRSRVRSWFVRRTGGFLPVWRGGTDLAVSIEAARAVLEAGAVFGIFPEGSRRGTPATVQPLRRGVALIGLRTGAPIVPVVLAGTNELYRGRRTALRVLPPTTALELAGLDEAPVPGTAAEVAALHAASDALRARLAPDVAELAAWCEDPPSAPRRWRWMSKIVA